MRYTHILWDWNGTLVDDIDLCLATTNALLAKRGRRVLVLERREVVGGAAVTEQPFGPDFKVPRKVLFMVEIPKGAAGKLQRIGLAAKLGLGG